MPYADDWGSGRPWAWRHRVRRGFKPVELSQSARAVLQGLDTTEDESNAAEPELRRRA